MSIFETLGELIGKAFRSLFQSISGLLSFKAEQLEDVNKEIAGESLDPEKFKTKEVKELAGKIKESLKHSPAGPADWAQSIMGSFMDNIWDVAMSIMLPSKMDTFEDAKASALWLSNLFADFIILSAVLEMVGTALTATLVRNLIHIFRLFAATFGMDRYLDACIAPALSTSIVPMLTRGYNAQYKTYIPTPGDLLRFQAHEVYEPEMRARYGLDAEKEELVRDLFYEQGFSDKIIDDYWADHWVHPAWREITDMYHRGEITHDDMLSWYRLVEIPPYWREKLTAISWDLPNRIETRMMARYGLVDKAWLVKHLERIGLHEDYRSIAADFMLAMGIRMDLSSRYSKGWLTADEVKTEIASFGMSEDINDRLYKWIVKNVQPDRVTAERDLTVTDICRGVKLGTIGWEEGKELIMDLGYDEWEADFKLEIKVGVTERSPESYLEFKRGTQSYKRAMGLEYKIPPPELIEAEKALKEAVSALKEAVDKKLKEDKLAPYLKAKSDATYRYRQLLLKWKEEPTKS